MKLPLIVVWMVAVLPARAAAPVHVWEKQEIVLTAQRAYANAYTDVIVWADLAGPGFRKRIYGFWDGDRTFRIRWMATAPGRWSWRTGSSTGDPGLATGEGSAPAIAWTDAEKAANPIRRGMIRPSPNGHALEYADGTPYLAIGDTWYSAGTNRFRWYDDDNARPIGPTAGFKDYVRLRQAQGFNWVNLIAAFPNWKTDDLPWRMVMNDPAHTTLRSAWLEFGTGSAKNMDNEGGRPFLFPGRVPGYERYFPDVDRINPAYFRFLDRKIDYLNAHGFVPFLEASRRDSGLCWFKYYAWPDSYSRYLEYIWARYQANVTVLSPVHLDIIAETVSPADYTRAIDRVLERFGPPPFGTLLSANANPSTLENWGENSWVTLHQTGNKREHENYWYLTEIYRLQPPRPGLNGEPYYAGYKDNRGPGAANYKLGAEGGSARDGELVRSGLYGCFLSGGLAGHVYGAEGIWGADIEPTAPTKMWDAFQWESAAQMHHLRAFAFSLGARRYQQLEPICELVSPSRSPIVLGYDGWAYAARTPDQRDFLIYFEVGCPPAKLRGARVNTAYRAEWFDPRTGQWHAGGTVNANEIGVITLPPYPSDRDWGLKLQAE